MLYYDSGNTTSTQHVSLELIIVYELKLRGSHVQSFLHIQKTSRRMINVHLSLFVIRDKISNLCMLL
jgi:hypothetical protein